MPLALRSDSSARCSVKSIGYSTSSHAISPRFSKLRIILSRASTLQKQTTPSKSPRSFRASSAGTSISHSMTTFSPSGLKRYKKPKIGTGTIALRNAPMEFFYRTIELPPGVDPSSIEATMSNGVLKIESRSPHTPAPRRSRSKTAAANQRCREDRRP